MSITQQRIRPLFVSSKGLRVWIRLVIFSAIVFGMGFVALKLERFALPSEGPLLRTVLYKMRSLLVLLVATAIMGRIEGRTLADYGLPWAQALRRKFWGGAVVGYVSLSVLVLVLWLARALTFHGFALTRAQAAGFGLVWALGFLLVALEEEFSFRGYFLFTLADGVGFWPAAILLSSLFALIHAGNSNESLAGLVNVGVVGLLLCVFLQRTGNLWFPIGFHAAWDWAETFFYGVPDSGQVAPGHLLETSHSGPVWLSGGAVGPEGSWVCTLFVVGLGIGFAWWCREVKYPPPSRTMARTPPVESPG